MQGEHISEVAVDQVATGAPAEVSGGESGEVRREDNRHYRRQRHRDCYCRGRNKACPKCGGTGQLLPNWRENLQAARSGQRPVIAPAPTSAYAAPSAEATASLGPAPAPVREPQQGGGYDRRDDRGYDRGGQDRSGYDRGGYDRGGQDRGSRRDRWQNRGQNRQSNGVQGNRGNQKSTVKMCPMCGEYVPNLRAHVLARHDD